MAATTSACVMLLACLVMWFVSTEGILRNSKTQCNCNCSAINERLDVLKVQSEYIITLLNQLQTNETAAKSCRMRLVDGQNSTNTLQGRVEVFVNGTWGTVCDDVIENTNETMNSAAKIVCRALRLPSENAKGYEYISAPNKPGAPDQKIWLDDLVCTGNEASLCNCQRREYGENNCGHDEDFTITCA